VCTLQAACDGSAMRDKLLAENGDEDEADNFIQDDDSVGDDDDEFGNEWELKAVGAMRRPRPESGVHRRPESAVHKKSDMNLPRPPCPAMDRFRVPATRLDPEEAKELRLDAVWPSFVVAYHAVVSRKYAVGASKMLLQYLQRGYPEYTGKPTISLPSARSVCTPAPGAGVRAQILVQRLHWVRPPSRCYMCCSPQSFDSTLPFFSVFFLCCGDLGKPLWGSLLRYALQWRQS